MPPAEAPDEGEAVEVLFRGRWIRATFLGGDSIAPGDGMDDEVWWRDHFVLDDDEEETPLTLPEDVHSSEPLPQWRRIAKGAP